MTVGKKGTAGRTPLYWGTGIGSILVCPRPQRPDPSFLNFMHARGHDRAEQMVRTQHVVQSSPMLKLIHETLIGIRRPSQQQLGLELSEAKR